MRKVLIAGALALSIAMTGVSCPQNVMAATGQSVAGSTVESMDRLGFQQRTLAVSDVSDMRELENSDFLTLGDKNSNAYTEWYQNGKLIACAENATGGAIKANTKSYKNKHVFVRKGFTTKIKLGKAYKKAKIKSIQMVDGANAVSIGMRGENLEVKGEKTGNSVAIIEFKNGLKGIRVSTAIMPTTAIVRSVILRTNNTNKKLVWTSKIPGKHKKFKIFSQENSIAGLATYKHGVAFTPLKKGSEYVRVQDGKQKIYFKVIVK